MSLQNLMYKPMLLAQQVEPVANNAGKTGIQDVKTEEVPIWDLVANVVEGQWYIMIPLALLSILAVYIFVERFMAIQKAARQEQSFMTQIKSFIQNGDLNSAKNLSMTTNHPIARMIGKGVSKIGRPIKDIQDSIENQGRHEVGKLEKGLALLATIAGAAPMIGFLGTTLGMIKAFNDMHNQGIDMETIAPGMMQAMVTTVGGLIVGIIAYMAYNFLVSKVDRVVHHMEESSMEFIDVLDQPGK